MVASTYINNVISFFIVIVGSSGQTVYSDFVVNTSIPTPVTVLSEGQNYTVSVRSAVNSVCMSGDARTTFTLPPANVGPIGENSSPPVLLHAIVIDLFLCCYGNDLQ